MHWGGVIEIRRVLYECSSMKNWLCSLAFCRASRTVNPNGGGTEFIRPVWMCAQVKVKNVVLK